jgi:predicted amino acid dehydrogenase
MIGIELDLDHVSRTQTGLLSILQEQALLLYLIVSYLLNVEHIRIAASFTQGNVLRIEPPLVADAAMCDQLIDALRRLLSVLQAGDAGELLTHLMGKGASAATAGSENGHAKGISSKLVTARIPSENASARFAFIVHLLGDGDLRRFDPSLGAVLDDEQLNALRLRISPFIKSFPYGRLVVRSTDGGVAEGELIVLPHLPSELLALSGKEALDLVQDAIDLAGERGAEVVGLGGFSSIVAGGGLAVHPQSGMKITSGNSLTTWAAVRAVEAACAQYEVDLANATVAIVGATGAIGHALSMLFAERTAKLILIGNPNAAEASLGKLRDVAQDCERHLGGLDRPGHNMPMLAHGRIERHELRAGQTSDPQLGITITTDIDHCLPKAQVILAATNAVVPFVSSRHVGQGAIVCDVSRPFNITPGLSRQRPDIRLVGGGLVQAPDASTLGHLEELDRSHVMVACAAETIVLALSGFQSRNLCGQLDVATVDELGRLAEQLGFSVAG